MPSPAPKNEDPLVASLQAVEENVPPPAPENDDPLVASLQAEEEIEPPPSPKNDDPLVASVPAPPAAPPKVSYPSTSSGHFDFWSHPFLFHFLLTHAQTGVELLREEWGNYLTFPGWWKIKIG